MPTKMPYTVTKSFIFKESEDTKTPIRTLIETMFSEQLVKHFGVDDAESRGKTYHESRINESQAEVIYYTAKRKKLDKVILYILTTATPLKDSFETTMQFRSDYQFNEIN